MKRPATSDNLSIVISSYTFLKQQYGVSEEEIEQSLLRQGAISIPLLKMNTLSGMISEARAAKFEKLPSEVGKYKTRQNMEVWHLEDDDYRSRFWQLADELSTFLGRQLVFRYIAGSFKFNQVEVLRYPKGSIGIEPHKDSARYANFICLCNLTGGGKFVTCSDRIGSNPDVHRCEAGDVVIMRGNGFYGRDARVFHYVPPVTSERLVCSIRQNTQP